jgi:8-amino-7-oxononanoate synthase
MDLFAKCSEWKEVQVAQRLGYYPYFREIQDIHDGTEVVIGGKPVIMVSSNNYLGLALDPRVREAAAAASMKWGASTSGSRLLNGTLAIHVELEEKLADFLGREAALCFSTGFQTNLGTLSALLTRHDVVFSDRQNHASILDGIQASHGEHKKYRHGNMDDLERQLGATPEEQGRLIVTDGVFSMEGDLANIPRLVELKEKYHARLMVDDAHGFGVMGPTGRGTAEHFGVHDKVDLQMATFSKSLASLGGVITGPREVINWIKHKSRAMLYSASMTPAAVAAALKALEIIKAEPERRERLWRHAEKMHREYRGMGFDTSPSVTPVIPLIIGDQMKCLNFWKRLTEEGVFASPVIKPAVQKELIRTSYMSIHTDAQLDRVLEVVQRCGREEGVIPYEKPHSRFVVRIAKPGNVGFVSSETDATTRVIHSGDGQFDTTLRNTLLDREKPVLERLSDTAELLAYRAANLQPEDVAKLADVPKRWWAQRGALRTAVMSRGVELLTRAQKSDRESQAED